MSEETKVTVTLSLEELNLMFRSIETMEELRKLKALLREHYRQPVMDEFTTLREHMEMSPTLMISNESRSIVENIYNTIW